MSKILVVEDLKGIRDEICDILRFEGFEVIFSEDGEKGLELAIKELPDLILSDILMPKLNGYQFLEELKKLPATKSIPFIFLSGKAQLMDLRKGMNLGAEDYLVKPFITEELIKVVKGKLKKHQLVQDNIDKLVDENEFLLKEAGRMAKIGYWTYDKKTDEIRWSKAIHEIFGSNPKYGRPDLEVTLNCFNEESRQKTIKATYDLTMNGVSYDVELQITNLKNQNIWVQDIGEPLYNDKNKIIGARGVMRDITKLKNDQEELRQAKLEVEESLKKVQISEFLLKEGSVMAKFGVYEINTKKDSKYFSDEMYRIFNLQLGQEHAFEAIRKAFKKQSRILLITYVQECMEKGIPFDTELEIELLEKPTTWIRILGKPIYDENNEIIGRRGIIQDITNIKISQFELELSKQKIQTTLELAEKRDYSLKEASKVAKIGYWEYNNLTDTATWSEYIYNIFGVDFKKRPQELSKTVKSFDEESQKKLSQATLDLTSKGLPYDIELRFINHKKEVVWARSVAQPVYNEKNEIVGRRGVFQNITDFKNTQLALELSNQKIKAALEQLEKSEYSKNEGSKIAKIGYWEHDLVTNAVTWSDYVYQIFESNPKTGIPAQNDIVKRFNKESQEKLEKATIDIITKGKPYDIELKFTNLKNKEVWLRNVAQPIFNQQNEIVGKRGVMQDITASKNAQLELELSKQEIQQNLVLLEKTKFSMDEASKMAKIGYWEYDILKDTYILSEYFYEEYEFDPKEKIPTRTEIYDKEVLEKLTEATLGVTSKGINYDIELKFVNKKNEEVWFRSVGQPKFNEQNEIIGIKGVLQNITASKKAQFALEFSKLEIETTLALVEENEYSLKEAGRMAKIGYWKYDKLTDTIFWSNAIHEIYGTDPKKGVPEIDVILSFYEEESRKKLVHATIMLATKGVAFDIVLQLTNLKNEVRWIRNIGEPMYNDKNEIIGRRGVSQDITEQKIKQNELDYKSAKLHDLNNALNEAQELSHLGNWEYIIETDSVTWSKELFNIFERSYKLGAPNYSEHNLLYTKESFTIRSQAVSNCIENETSYDVELDIYASNGSIKHIISRGRVLKDANNIVIGCYGTVQDVTERKLIQKALDHKNEKVYELNNALNQAQKLSHIGSWYWNMEEDSAEWSDEMYNIYGVTKSTFYPSHENVVKTVLPEDLNKIEQGYSELLSGKVVTPFEFRIKRPSGEIRTLYIVALEKKSEENVFGVTMDITERKKIEEEHFRVKDSYKRLFNTATVSIWNEDLSLVFEQIEELRKLNIPNIKTYLEQHTDVLFSMLEKVKVNNVNRATLKLFKAKSSKEFLGKIQYTLGEGASFVFIKLIESIWNNEKTFTSEVNYKTLKGDEFAALFSIAIPQTKVEQKIVAASIQSIQSIKDAESANRESLHKLNEAQKLARIGSWLFNPLTQKIDWSDETFHIWGFDPEKGAPEFDVVVNLVHVDDRELFNSVVDRAVSSGKSYDIEHRICLKNGEQKIIRAIGQAVFGNNSEVVGLAGTTQDITSQKQALDKIEKAEEMYRLLTDNSNDLICLQEPDSTFKYISPSIKNLLGYDQSDFLGKTVFSIVHRDDIESLKSAMKKKVFSGEQIEAYTFRIRHKEGHFVWLEFLSSPVYEENEIGYFVTSARDVTQWMLAKQEIQEYQTSLQKLTIETSLLEEKQKKEIASNIHDHLSQSLIISKMRINELKKNPHLNVIQEDLKFIETHISEALENSRKITYELSPPVLYQLGIVAALNWLLDDVEATHKIECRFNSNINTIKLDDGSSILLFRSIQEVLTNTIKYAKATLITLNFDKESDGASILITDNGVGFDTSLLNNYHNHSGSGFGLFTVKERIRNIQGKFTIVSEINVGTIVKIFIPLTP